MNGLIIYIYIYIYHGDAFDQYEARGHQMLPSFANSSSNPIWNLKFEILKIAIKVIINFH